MKVYNTPYFGAAYYPEDWDESEMEHDVVKMKQAGFNTMRIGEFAWRKMEPKPGEYNFDWLHRVVDRLSKEGIAVILGTPTATPPVWLTKQYPEVLIENESGRVAQHGGRRHCCSNSANYRKYCARIVEKMGEEFGGDENVIGWQIDNEIYTFWMGCFCSECHKKFHKDLASKFKTIEELNSRWNLNIFSQAYDSFDEIPTPRDARINPHQKMEWLISHQNADIDFVHMQADILKKYTKAPIGTDTMPFGGMDYKRLNKKLDVVQYNHYNTAENLWQCAFWFDYLRALKPTPFWNTETSTGWNGADTVAQGIKSEGFCFANSWLPIALGGEANMYWPWRTHWGGQELMHGGVLDTSGRPYYIFGEVQKTGETFKKAADFLKATIVKADVALQFSSLNWNMFESQGVIAGDSYLNSLLNVFYKPMIDSWIRPDVIDASEALEKYKLIFSPMMLTLDDENLPERMTDWVKAGGTWVVGPLTDMRTQDGTRYKNRPYGMLEDLLGERFAYIAPDLDGIMRGEWNADSSEFKGNRWYELFEKSDTATSLASICSGHTSLIGKSFLLTKMVGKGTVIFVGTFPSYEDMRKIISLACKAADIAQGTQEGNSILAIPREGKGRSGLILMEHAGKGGTYTLANPMRDILSGNEFAGTVDLQPYDLLVLE